jgi:predicted DNA-binding protein (UPF0251 family)
MHRRRKGGRGRFPIQPRISGRPLATKMVPMPVGQDRPPIYLDLAEAEVLRLVDIDGLYQEQAGSAMGVSRGTVWRLLASARGKMAQALHDARPIVVGIDEE